MYHDIKFEAIPSIDFKDIAWIDWEQMHRQIDGPNINIASNDTVSFPGTLITSEN